MEMWIECTDGSKFDFNDTQQLQLSHDTGALPEDWAKAWDALADVPPSAAKYGKSLLGQALRSAIDQRKSIVAGRIKTTHGGRDYSQPMPKDPKASSYTLDDLLPDGHWLKEKRKLTGGAMLTSGDARKAAR